jgi:hypothetical protein
MGNRIIHLNRVLKERFQRQLPWHGARRLAAAALLAVGLLAAAAWSEPALAAMQLSYFNIVANPTGVVLEWGTAAEVNLAGFDILCKQATEPDSAYHPIGFMPAKGGPTTPAQYTFPVTSGLVPGVPYCFQLREVTTDGSSGEAPALCGYGPNVTPTPSLGVVPTFFVTQTTALGALPTDAAGNPIRVPPLPGAVPTDAFGNPIVTPVVPAAVPTDAFGNPLPTAVPTDALGNPLPAAVPTDAFGNPLPAAVPTDAFGNPLPVAVPTDAFGNPLPAAVPTDAFGSPLATPAPPTPTIDPFAPPTPIVVTPQAAVPVDPALAAAAPGDPALAAAAPVDPALAARAAAADPALVPATALAPAAQYVVVTATPTQPPVALGGVLTPLPTTTPAPPSLQLVSGVEPTTQNLMVMFLCLTFTGASAIGVLGLITSIMFMRGRSSQQTALERYTPPRRR